jgi:hypothetical protein
MEDDGGGSWILAHVSGLAVRVSSENTDIFDSLRCFGGPMEKNCQK